MKNLLAIIFATISLSANAQMTREQTKAMFFTKQAPDEKLKTLKPYACNLATRHYKNDYIYYKNKNNE